ncbi:hypothetical protein ACTI_30560 [Actinoplanes sp. OR16]|uniref:hypothetical protein n=1 Tax=Actinoplanes sp. OR16 TaxID=946334 RepID=UPI000F6D6BC0|nr:hypothetical protein [Actinoplanes sp. OR16]BBH66371.1 hypothetical protein ACTI_30560 [Actinoplanes sp. OR16]
MNILAEMLLTEPAPMAIWAALLLATLPALVVLASPHNVRHPGRALIDTVGFLRRRAERRDEERRQRLEEALHASRYAEEIQVAADQAGLAAQRWQGGWEDACERVDAAWREWQAADARRARSRATAAFGTPYTAKTPAEYAYRERFLHRAVEEATARGELPAEALADALSGRNGWDARLHPADQERVVQQVSADYLARLHERAAEAERAAWRDAARARRNRDSLVREAAIAEARAAAVEHLIPAAGVTSREIFRPAFA